MFGLVRDRGRSNWPAPLLGQFHCFKYACRDQVTIQEMMQSDTERKDLYSSWKHTIGASTMNEIALLDE
jgi:hypothetical protein